MKGHHLLSVPKINSYPLFLLKGGGGEDQDPGLRLEVFQIFKNRNRGILKELLVLRHQILRSANLVLSAFLGLLAAKKSYFKSWQSHVATSKTTPFEYQLHPPMWGESQAGQSKSYATGIQAPLKCCHLEINHD